MANEISGEDSPEPGVTSTNHLGRQVLLAGIAGACLLGVGAGLWARPAAEDQRGAAPASKYVARPAQKLEIVLADPLAAPLAPATAPAIEGPTVSAEMINPADIAPAPAEPLPAVRPPPGLMKVQDVAPAEIAPPAPRLEKAKVEKAQAPKPKAAKAKAEKAKPGPKARRDALKVAEAKRQKAKAKPDIQLAKAAEEAAQPAADEAGKSGRLTRIKTVIAKPFKDRRKTGEVEDARLAKAEPEKAAKPKSKKAAETVKLAKAEPPKAARSKAASKRCVSSDPGAAIVCADPSLSAADRQLSRAYRDAEAAGVPGWQLKQQQQRWLAARAAAAREAPWAVHDVYLARIAELHDMTRDAREGY